MSITSEQLLALIDGRLEPDAAESLRREIAEDADAAERLQQMERAGEALQNASAPDPSGLDTLVDAIRSGMLDDASDDAGTAARNPAPNPVADQSVPAGKPTFGTPMQMAACLAFLALVFGAGFWSGNALAPKDPTGVAGQPTWVVRVVDYHTLYSRETVAPANASTEDVRRMETTFEDTLKTRMHIPAMDGRRLAFKRGQILQFGNSPVIQLAYLPDDTGTPVALCLKPTRKGDSKPVYVKMRGMGVVRWRRNGLAYVLVGHRTKEQLLADTSQAIEEIISSETI